MAFTKHTTASVTRICMPTTQTTYSAITERLCNASCLSAVSFNSTIPQVQPFIISYFSFRFLSHLGGPRENIAMYGKSRMVWLPESENV